MRRVRTLFSGWLLGWNYFSVHSNEEFTNHDQSYAAGFLEGAMTAKQIYTQIKVHYTDPAPPRKVQDFFDANAKWEEEEKKSGRNPEYWEHRTLLDVQVDGIYDGYMYVATGAMVCIVVFENIYYLFPYHYFEISFLSFLFYFIIRMHSSLSVGLCCIFNE